MISFLQLFVYGKTLMSFILFTYTYKFFYDSCNEKIVINVKNEKPKKVIKTRILLSFMYLVLLLLLYFLLNIYSLLIIVLGILITVVALIHKYKPLTFKVLRTVDTLPIIKKIWHIYSMTVNVIFKLLSPCFKVFDKKIYEFKEQIINEFKQQLGFY
jgi:Na+/H+ antiporter NhaD/arsenite permease-like protein